MKIKMSVLTPSDILLYLRRSFSRISSKDLACNMFSIKNHKRSQPQLFLFLLM